MKKAQTNSNVNEILQEVLLYLQQTNIHGEVSVICILHFAQTRAKRNWTGKHRKNWQYGGQEVTLPETRPLVGTKAQRSEPLSYSG